MKIACKNCGANLEYRLVKDDAYCAHCQNSYKIDDLNFNEESIEEYECSSCGAISVCSSADFILKECAYCGAKEYRKVKLDTQYHPNGVVPFKISQEEATNKFRNFINNNKEVHKKYKEAIEKANVYGVYLPYSYQDEFFNRTGDIFAKDEFAERYKNKDENISQSISKSNNKYFLANILPFDLNEAKKFNPIYFDKNVGYLVKQQFVEDYFKSRKADYYLVPVWIFEVEFLNRKYYVFINGQTGEMSGDFFNNSVYSKDYLEEPRFLKRNKRISRLAEMFLLVIHLIIIFGMLIFFIKNINLFLNDIKRIIIPYIIINIPLLLIIYYFTGGQDKIGRFNEKCITKFIVR